LPRLHLLPFVFSSVRLRILMDLQWERNNAQVGPLINYLRDPSAIVQVEVVGRNIQLIDHLDNLHLVQQMLVESLLELVHRLLASVAVEVVLPLAFEHHALLAWPSSLVVIQVLEEQHIHLYPQRTLMYYLVAIVSAFVDA